MRKTSLKTALLLFTCVLSFPVAHAFSQGNSRALPSQSRSDEIDLSTPERTLALFVKAFRTGDDNLLTKVLGRNADLPEFNPTQKITSPCPGLKGYDIRKYRVVLKQGQYAGVSQPGDIEAYVLLQREKTAAGIRPACNVALWEKGAYLFRSINNAWKIVAISPFWPEDAQQKMLQ